MKPVVTLTLTAAIAVAAVRLLAAQSPAPTVEVRIDSARHETTLTVGPLRIPGATTYSHHFAPAPAPFVWPASGFIQGFKMDLIDSGGSVDINETFSTAKTSRSVPVMSFTGRTTGVSMQIPYYVVPGNRLATGDVHHLFAGLSSGSISREALIDVAGVSDTSVTFGSVLSAVTIAASRRTGFATLIPPYQASSRFGQVTP